MAFIKDAAFLKNGEVFPKIVCPLMLRSIRCQILTFVLGLSSLIASGIVVAEGVYGRVGVNLDQATDTVFMDINCDSSPQVPLYGCGEGTDGHPYRTTGTFNLSYGLSLGVGSRISPQFRVELLGEFGRTPAFKGRANYLAPSRQQSVATELWSDSLSLVGFFDAPEITFFGVDRIQPFLGAGLTISRNQIKTTKMTFPFTTTIVRGAKFTDIGWLVTTGIAFPLGEDKRLDVAWRYSDAGEVRTRPGRAHVLFNSRTRSPIDLNISTTRAKLEIHSLSFSIRSSF